MSKSRRNHTREAAHCVLLTPRLVLREWVNGDRELLQQHCNTEEVMYWLDGVQSPEQLQEDVTYFKECQERSGHTFWVMEAIADGSFLGFCGLIDVPDEDSTILGELEIGWRLRKDAWGHGFVTEAAAATLRFAFARLHAKQVVSRVSAGNVRSRNVMTRLGLKCRRSLSYAPTGEDERLLVYAIDRDVWLNSAVRPPAGAHLSG